jgi:signal transduction histidine kinase
MDVFEQHVLDALPFRICTVDLEGRITSANQSWSAQPLRADAPGADAERSIVGAPLARTVADERSRAQIERAMELLRTGRAQTVSWESTAGASDGDHVFLMQVSPLHDGHAVNGYVFSSADITPSHRSRESLIDAGIALSRPIAVDRTLHEMAQQIRRTVPYDAIAVALADDGVPSARLAYQTGHDVPSRIVEERYTPAWRAAIDGRCVTFQRTDRGVALTAPLASERVLGAVTIVADDLESPHRFDEARQMLTTIAAQTAAAIERSRHIERVDHKRRLDTIGEVAAGVAQELRNPLFGISSAAQLVRFRAREDPVVEKNVGRILREVDRLSRMATALLELGGPVALALAPGDPDAVWDTVIERERGRLESRALHLQRHRADPPARCPVDRDHLAQACAQILVNAADAAPEASDLVLASSTLAGGAWRCDLHNGGPAIAPDALPRIFELFFSTKGDGSGIGLPLAQRIVEAHGGTISVASAPDAGTTVTIVLPPAD